MKEVLEAAFKASLELDSALHKIEAMVAAPREALDMLGVAKTLSWLLTRLLEKALKEIDDRNKKTKV